MKKGFDDGSVYNEKYKKSCERKMRWYFIKLTRKGSQQVFL